MRARIRTIYEFGHFHLDAGERLLFKDAQPVPLSPKAFDTLLLLVENSGRLVDKDVLIRLLICPASMLRNSTKLKRLFDAPSR